MERVTVTTDSSDLRGALKEAHLPVYNKKIPRHEEVLVCHSVSTERHGGTTSRRPFELHTQLLLLVTDRNIKVLCRIPYRLLLFLLSSKSLALFLCFLNLLLRLPLLLLCRRAQSKSIRKKEGVRSHLSPLLRRQASSAS